VPRENLNTDGIYGKDHTYRELAAAEMAAVVMQNYDPAFAALVRNGRHPGGHAQLRHGLEPGAGGHGAAGGGHRAGHRGELLADVPAQRVQQRLHLPRVPGLVRAVEVALEAEVAAGEATVIPGDALEVDFRRGVIGWRGEEYRFPTLGRVPQGLVVAGGAEAQVRARLGRRSSRRSRCSSRSNGRHSGLNRRNHSFLGGLTWRSTRWSRCRATGSARTVLPEAIRVLDAVGFDAEYVHADIGWEFWIREGNALPDRTVELLASTSWACSAPSRRSRTRRSWS
jgi:hypothetical protein